MHAVKAVGESDYQRRIANVGQGRILPGTSIEIIREPKGRGNYTRALFDFDGTLSLLREGWQSVMAPMMVEELAGLPGSEPEDELCAYVDDLILRTTGKQTIYQMMDLCNEISIRGGSPLDPAVYKKKYLDLLMECIKNRLEGVRCGQIDPQDMLIPGSYAILDALKEHGVQVYLASGTDEANVREEAELLGIAPYFGERIYGAIEDYKNYSKARVIERILQDNNIAGDQLLGFGDGYVELDNTVAAGGTAIGIATDEVNKDGRIDVFKRDRLAGVGADIIMPDFSDAGTLVAYLFGAID